MVARAGRREFRHVWVQKRDIHRTRVHNRSSLRSRYPRVHIFVVREPCPFPHEGQREMKIKRGGDDAGRHQTFVLYPECHIKWLPVSLTVSNRNPPRILQSLSNNTTSFTITPNYLHTISNYMYRRIGFDNQIFKEYYIFRFLFYCIAVHKS